MNIYPYLAFDGQCAAAFQFYERALGGQITLMLPYSESPMADAIAPEHRHRILHATLRVGGRIIQGGDAPPNDYSRPQGFSIAYSADTIPEAERVFAALSEGARIQMPLGPTFWTPRFGMLIDRFCIPWIVNCNEANAGS